MKREFVPEEDAQLMTAYHADTKRRGWLQEVARKWNRTPRALEHHLHELPHGEN